MKRLSAYLATVVALVLATLVAPASGPQPQSTAHAADLSYFDPGNIISDAVFYDYLSMNAPDVQAFLNAKGANCTAGSLCLKNYTAATTTQAADSRCAAYSGGDVESASTIIAKVAQACRISPRVLLVTLQKESGLVTKTSPYSGSYTYAMGYGCPDSTGCSGYEGLFNQVYHAAHAFQSYRLNPTWYSALAGMTNNVSYYPATGDNLNNARCGTEAVNVANQATAALYDYTPYVPNAAALAAGYGTGDNCSSYGNRNFWNYFTDWFGSTQSVGGSAIYAYYQQIGGSSGALGAPIRAFFCGLREGGCFQTFQNGSIYWSPSSGAHSVTGNLGTDWAQRGWETGVLGYPVSDGYCGLVNGGCFQNFQGGSLYYSPGSGAHFVRGAIRAMWGATGWEGGPLGYPVTDEICGLRNGGCFNHFQNGSVYWTPATGAQPVTAAMQTAWATLGWETGPLGYPVSAPACGLTGSGCLQTYQGGSLYYSPGSGAHFVRGAIRAMWGATGWESGPLGYPVTDEICGLRNGGCFNHFQNGSVYWTPATGAQPVTAAMQTAWAALGWETGPLGYPVSAPACGLTGSGCFQTYQGGSLYYSPGSGAHFVRGAIRAMWGATGWEGGPLGYPVTDEICGLRNGGCFNHFQNGSVYWTPATGAHTVAGPIRDAWAAQGWETGRWGYPVSNPVSVAGGTSQQFQGGTATLDTTTGQVTFR